MPTANVISGVVGGRASIGGRQRIDQTSWNPLQLRWRRKKGISKKKSIVSGPWVKVIFVKLLFSRSIILLCLNATLDFQSLPKQDVQNIKGHIDFMRLQAFAHHLTHVCSSPWLQDGGQLPPTGQEEGYSCVHRHHGPTEPQYLSDKRDQIRPEGFLLSESLFVHEEQIY